MTFLWENIALVMLATYYTSTAQLIINKLYHNRVERRIQTQHVRFEITGLQSTWKCLLRCTLDDNCQTVAWGSQDKLCQLAIKETDNYGLNDTATLEIAVDWITYSKIRHRVLIYEGPSGIYSLTYNEAVEFCIGLGTVIASPQQLLNTRANGYHMCQCGWLSDQTIGMVMFYAQPSCAPLSTDIIPCTQALGSVYCLTS